MDIYQTLVTTGPQETQEAGRALADRVKKTPRQKGRGARIICLHGELGSGKTTFVQGFAKGLGITHRLLSPTFIIVRHYQLPDLHRLYHVDLYRLKDERDIEHIGLHQLFIDDGSYVLIEWAERLGNEIPKPRTDLTFRALEDGNHEITLREIYD